MVSELNGFVDSQTFVVVLIIVLLIGYFVYKEWPEFKKRVGGHDKLDNSIIERLDKIESRLTDMEVKINRDYSRLNSLESETDRQRQLIANSLEERELLMRGVLACLKGLSEQGCNGPVSEGIHDIEDYLNRQAHRREN